MNYYHIKLALPWQHDMTNALKPHPLDKGLQGLFM